MIDPSAETGLDALIAELTDAGIAKVHTIGIGKVQSYDHDKQRATVLPVVHGWRLDADGASLVAETWDPVANVPVVFDGAAGWGVCGPLEVGAELVLFVCERSIADWKGTGRAGSPADLRRFDWSDVIATPARTSDGAQLAAERRHATDLVVYSAHGIRLVNSTTTHRATRDDRVAARLTRLEDAFAAHAHPIALANVQPAGPGSPTASSTAPTNAGAVTPRTTADDVAADRVYLE